MGGKEGSCQMSIRVVSVTKGKTKGGKKFSMAGTRPSCWAMK